MQRNLTPRFIDSLKPEPGKRLAVFDTKVTGLCVRVTDAGKASFYVMSRDPRGKQVWAQVKDGNAPVATLAEARALAPAGVANIKNGKVAYPKIEAPAEVDTYERVVERFIRQWARPRQRTWAETERLLLAVPWQGRPFTEITAQDAAKHIGEVAERSPSVARITLSWLTTLWRWAWRQYLVEYPIMDRLQAADFGIVKKPRDIVYTDAEIKTLWTAGAPVAPRELAFVKLLFLLGVRSGALRGMRKCELDDLEHPTLWTIPPERVKQRKSREDEGREYVVPISGLARRILVPLLRAAPGELIFEGIKPGVPLDIKTGLARRLRRATGIERWMAHGTRHTLASWLQQEGHDGYDRALALQHAAAGTVTAGYSHSHSLDRHRELLEKWAGHIGEVVAGAEDVELLA